MYNRKLTFLLLTLVVVMACKKDITKPVSFSSTDYEALAPYDDQGKPSNLLKDNISSNLLSFINETLPPGQDLRISNPGLLNNSSANDISLSQRSSVYLTYVSNGAGMNDVIGFYTYPTGNPPASAKDIKKITYIFPSAGNGTPLTAGDKVNLGTFDPGITIGFVLLQHAWDPATKQINSKAVHFCYNDALNPEVDPKLKKHVVLVNYQAENKILIGFEDLDRTKPDCDHDFNDVVLYATITQ
jgi:hypothetical protein